MVQDRTFCKVVGCGFYNWGIAVRLLQGQGIFFSEASRSALGPTKPPIPSVLGL